MNGVKHYSAEEIAEDIKNWTEDELRSAFVVLAAINNSTDWNEVKVKFESAFNRKNKKEG